MTVQDVLRRGGQCEAAGDLDGAEAAYQEADKLGDAEGAILLGQVIRRRGDAGGAAEAFRRAEARGHREAGSCLGNLLSDNGDFEGAKAAYERSIAAGSMDAVLNLGLMLAQQGAVDEALGHLRVAQENGDTESSWAIGRLLEDREDYAGAAAAYQRGADGGNAQAAYGLGAVLAKLEDQQGARAAFRRAHDLGHPGAGQVLELLDSQALDSQALDSQATTPVAAETTARWAKLYAVACGEVLAAAGACLEAANRAVGARNMAAQRPQHEISIRTFTQLAEQAELEFGSLYRTFDKACAAARDTAAQLLASHSDPLYAEAILASIADDILDNVAAAKVILSVNCGPSPASFVQDIREANEMMRQASHDEEAGNIYRPRAAMQPAERTCPWCAETIKAAAVICRFCGKDVQIQPSVSSLPDSGPVMTPAAIPQAPDATAGTALPGDADDTASAGRMAAAAAATWGTVKNAARQAQQHANPALLQHGVDAVQDALLESNVAKVDKKTGKLKVRKLGVAKAAIRPGQTVRKAIEGAAVGDRLKSYTETVRALPAASSLDEFASYPSKRDYLRDWARGLIAAAGITPTGPLIDSYANAAALGICSQVFIPLGAPRGISDTGQYFHPDPVPAGTAQETFDALYLKVAPSPAEQQHVNEQIVAYLNSTRDLWLQRIRQQHS